MSDLSTLAKVHDALNNAEVAVSLAKQLLSEVSGLDVSSSVNSDSYAKKAAQVGSSSAMGKVIEGVFDGQNMIDQKGAIYPVPANYASKSKLIPGDVLKLTVTEEGKFLYKQIGPVERKTVVGPLVHKEGQYMILANGKSYKVLLASVTYFRASVGDEVTLIIPATEDSEWGAIEAVLPKFEDDAPENKIKKKDDLDTIDEELDI